MSNVQPSTPFSFISTGTSADSTLTLNTAGRLTMLTVSNINAAVRYLKVYDKATAPTVGTDSPVLRVAVPGATTGDGWAVPLPDGGLAFSNGIGFGIVTGSADNNSTAVAAGDLIVNGAYRKAAP